MSSILAALVGALTALIVVFFNRRSENLKQLQTTRTAAYADFIRGVSGLAMIQKEPGREERHFVKGWELQMLVADSKARIGIYGSGDTVKVLSNFLRGGTVLDSKERAVAFTAVCQQFRKDSGEKQSGVSDNDMHYLLFGLEPKDYF